MKKTGYDASRIERALLSKGYFPKELPPPFSQRPILEPTYHIFWRHGKKAEYLKESLVKILANWMVKDSEQSQDF